VVHAAAVEVNGRTLVLLYPKEVIHPTPVWGLMELPDTRFLADGWLLADPSGRIHALEKGLYYRTSVVQSYPDYLQPILSSKFENVPEGHDSLTRLAASPGSRAMVAGRSLFGKARITREGTVTAVFNLMAGGGEPIRPVPATPFSCSGYEVRVGAVPGHPREVARLIART
jgi:hypothetical protein